MLSKHPLVRSTVRTVLLQKFLPLAIAVIFIFICIQGVLLSFLSLKLASFLGLLASSFIVIYLVLRSTSMISDQLEKELQESLLRELEERKRSEEATKAALLEKEVLLKEIHHRVKNNLQVISSLLRLQAETAKDKDTADLFLDSQERVGAMAMVHEYLYKSDDLARINFSAYVAGLVRNLYRTFGVTSLHKAAQIRVDDVHLSLDMAVPCGLLLTELVSNAVKYAYPDAKNGPVDIRFKKLPEGQFEMSVADQGVGFPKGFDWKTSDSLGLRLVRLLTEQLQGQIQMQNHSGTKFVVTFKDGGR